MAGSIASTSIERGHPGQADAGESSTSTLATASVQTLATLWKSIIDLQPFLSWRRLHVVKILPKLTHSAIQRSA